MRRIRSLLCTLVRNQHGSTIVLVALAMVALIGFTGLVIDGGNLYLTKSNLQKAVDAAALAGAQELPTDPFQAETEARYTAELNEVLPEEVTVSFQETNHQITVTAVSNKSLFLFPVLGIDSASVSARAVARINPLTNSRGVIPLGIDVMMNYDFDQQMTIKVGEATVGNFGVLAISGTGADNFRNDLKHGSQTEIGIGTILETQTGNMVGPTKQAIENDTDSRFKQCPWHGTGQIATFDNHPPNCPRVVTTPLYEPVLTDQNQVKQVKVVGFASFFIDAVGQSNGGAEVVGRFIERTSAGATSATQNNFGTYGIKLTE
jgi:Flp pilus assembly protein TadG